MKYPSKKILVNLILIFSTLIILFPVIYIFLTSIKNFKDIVSGDFFFQPKNLNYIEIFTGRRSNFLDLTINSLIVSSCVSVICGIFGSLCAYSLSRLNVPKFITISILLWLLFIHMIPSIVYVTPFYIWTREFGIYDTPFAIVIAHVVMFLPLSIVTMMNYFSEVPKEIEEASKIDGCGHWQTFSKVVIPLVRPGVAAMCVLVFVFSWKEFLFAMSLSTTTNGRTIPVGIANFVQEFNIRYGEMAAGSFFAMIPALILVIFAQKHIIKGLTVGAVKG